jgi:hypothetical protein
MRSSVAAPILGEPGARFVADPIIGVQGRRSAEAIARRWLLQRR